MKVYVASSWRNPIQPSVVGLLREAGHEVYDFRNPAPGNNGFSWKQCATEENIKNPRAFRDTVLTHPIAQAGFCLDMEALMAADATVLVLPCGRSAHLELGYATGAGQRTIVLLDDPMSEPELMYLMNTRLCVNIEEVLEALQVPTTQERQLEDALSSTKVRLFAGDMLDPGDTITVTRAELRAMARHVRDETLDETDQPPLDDDHHDSIPGIDE